MAHRLHRLIVQESFVRKVVIVEERITRIEDLGYEKPIEPD